jgi:hypothetical protein
MDGQADHRARTARGLGWPSLDGRSRNAPVAPLERGLPWREPSLDARSDGPPGRLGG